MLYYFTASNKDAQKHYEDTIKQPYPIANDFDMLDEPTKKLLIENGLDRQVHMWGATPGENNIKRWEKLKNGDKVLAYVKGNFEFYGTVVGKTNNVLLAEKVWGRNDDGATWEYIYFIKDLKPVNFDVKKFTSFFGYSKNFNPQGFSNIDNKKLNIKIRQYHDIDKLINVIQNDYLISDEDIDEDNFQTTLDGNFDSIDITKTEVKEPRKKPREVKGRKIWPRDPKKSKKALKLAHFKCEVDQSHQTFISDASKVNYMEAHHLIPMSLQHNFEVNIDTESNIVSLCPNCHRKIHLATNKVRQEIILTLYEKRNQQLSSRIGITINIDDLLGYYGIEMI